MSGRIPPCALERGAFMSERSHVAVREHPYARSLKELRPARLSLPAHSVHGTPYFWLHRNKPCSPNDPSLDSAGRRGSSRRALPPAAVGDGRRQPACGHRSVLPGRRRRPVIDLHLPQAQPPRGPAKAPAGGSGTGHRPYPARALAGIGEQRLSQPHVGDRPAPQPARRRQRQNPAAHPSLGRARRRGHRRHRRAGRRAGAVRSV